MVKNKLIAGTGLFGGERKAIHRHAIRIASKLAVQEGRSHSAASSCPIRRGGGNCFDGSGLSFEADRFGAASRCKTRWEGIAAHVVPRIRIFLN